MKKSINAIIFVLLSFVVLLAGCGKHYVLTTPLQQPLAHSSNCLVGDIVDELPGDMEEGKKPTKEDILKFKIHLSEQVNMKGILDVSIDAESPQYRIEGSILDFSKGSKTAMFLIGFGAGKVKLTAELELINIETGKTIFAGNFTRSITDWSKDYDKIFKDMAKDFAKALEKEMTNLGRK